MRDNGLYFTGVHFSLVLNIPDRERLMVWHSITSTHDQEPRSTDASKRAPRLPQVLTQLEARTDHEINAQAIRVLEQQIEGHRDERTIVRLKRVRNSLLNVSTLPTEILGDVFHRNVILESAFDGLEEGSYNFLLVCHHWFKVASRTPELWSCWGNNLQDWKKRCHCCRVTPLDLVLDGMDSTEGPLDDNLRSALQDHATRNTIRRVHLWTENLKLLSFILSSLCWS